MTKDQHKKPKHNSQNSAHRKVFDVTRPGKAPASPNSRSVIGSSKPPVADDQFVPSAPPLRASDPYVKHDLMDPKHKKDLQPLSSAVDFSSATTAAAAAADTAPLSAPAMPAKSEAEADEASSTPLVSAAVIEPAPNKEVETEVQTASPGLQSIPSEPEPTEAEAAAPAETQPIVPIVAEQGSAAIPSSEAAIQSPESTEEETPAHLALEQTVETSSDVPIWEHPDTSQQVAGSDRGAHAASGKARSIEDLLAETGAPVLEPEQSPSLIVSHHNTHHVRWWQVLLIILLIIVLAAAVLNLLLDAEIVHTGSGLPHTDLFK
jgi:hypothetical protein